MDFQRLRLSGFKSFIDPTEFRIEPGLTGVVGPNGCGKSNVLEGLRWVMGAASAKAMRGEGMDDVIFAGSGSRPSRNHAEVALSIDNSDHTAPAQFNGDSVLEVVRRIDRGQGSTYRINGREVRARDVQLLFADASTGANSPALVRQGQISELIAAKPQNRRRILEEAGGVSGLHTRRHEAELRLRAAETNLNRLDDVLRELDANLARLRREARQAERYKTLSAEIRTLQAAALHGRWSEARQALETTQKGATAAAAAVEAGAREAAKATGEALAAEEAIKPLREEEQIAAAILQRLVIERDRIEGDAARAQSEIGRLEDELERLGEARDRESHMVGDAGAALERLGAELAEVEAATSAAPSRIPELEAAFKAADELRAAAEAELERLAAQVAADEARRRAAAARIQEARERLGRTVRALELATADRKALGAADTGEAAQAATRLETLTGALTTARAALEAAEAERQAAAEAENASRETARKLEDQLGRLKTEARGLAQLTTQQARGGFKPALDAVAPQKGYEAALTAALGDDLDAALDSKAPAFWGGHGDVTQPDWPQGATPLAPLVKAPAELAARLAFTALVARVDGDRLAKGLPIGARLVSKEGDLWRWDGFVSRAEAARPAAIRLEQKTRLAEAESEIERLTPAAAKGAQDQKAAAERLQKAESALREARRLAQEAERAIAPARDAVERLAREGVRRDARAQSLDETIARFEAERIEAESTFNTATAEGADAGGETDASPMLTEARGKAAEARETAAHARADLEQEVRSRQVRIHRLESLKRDIAEWKKRVETAELRIGQLAKEDERSRTALSAARAAPEEIEMKRSGLMDELAIAQARRTRAADALQTAEDSRASADRAARAAEAEASQARELRAALTARLEAARDRLAEIIGRVRETARMEPEALAQMLEGEKATRLDPADIEERLYKLERDRDAIGPVNLRAEEESGELAERVTTMKAERADLTGAIARLREGIDALNAEGRDRLLAAFETINGHFQALFHTLFGGGQAELRLIESDDPLEAGLEIYACPPGKRLSTMSLMSGGEQALTAAALIFGVFLANPAPICVLDEVDAPLDDANVDRFCNMLDEMRNRTRTRFVVITHNPVTMSRMDRLFGVTMPERGVSQLVSVDLRQAEAMVAG